MQEEPGLGLVLLVAAMAGAGAGLCFGAAQWFILRRHAERASRWIWIHVPAWALAMSAIFLGASLPASGSSGWFIALTGAMGGVLGGLLLGAVTGLVAKDLRPWVDEQHWSLQGKVCAVTGANSGIGQAVAAGLARLGASVVLLCRRQAEGERVRRSILARQPGADVSLVTCDVGDFRSVRRAAAQLLSEFRRLDVLVHNAGATFPQLMTAAVHPGAVLTGAQARLPRLARALIHTLARPAFVRPEVGAVPVLRLAAHPDLPHLTGRYFDRCHLAPDVADAALAQTFWAACEDMTGEH